MCDICDVQKTARCYSPPPDWYVSVSDEPFLVRYDPSPTCFICEVSSMFLTRIGYGSKHDGEYICGKCLDEAISK